tara:strand:+ start:122 stop:1015 length:894 start_codon:yes stop_codon:yes gene_type:complete
MSKHIFWIASFPKSGNTLLRAILSSLFFSEDGKFDFDLLKPIPTFENKTRLNFIKKINQNDFNSLNKLNVLSKYWNLTQSKSNLGFEKDMGFLKTHHALVKYDNKSFTNEESCKGFIYILRDPRDVAISWSHHSKITLDQSVSFLTNELSATQWNESKKSLLKKNINPLVVVSSWEQNALSWIETQWKIPKLILRYEDLVYDKINSIESIANYFVKNFNFKFSNLEKKIKNIVETTNFIKLKEREKELGFKEATNGAFFRVGKKNQWKNKLNKNQLNLIESKFKKTMTKFGYQLNDE